MFPKHRAKSKQDLNGIQRKIIPQTGCWSIHSHCFNTQKLNYCWICFLYFVFPEYWSHVLYKINHMPELSAYNISHSSVHHHRHCLMISNCAIRKTNTSGIYIDRFCDLVIEIAAKKKNKYVKQVMDMRQCV